MSGTTIVTAREPGDILSESVILSQDFLNQILSNIQKVPSLDQERDLSLNQLVTSLSLEVGTFTEITTLITRMVQKKHKQIIHGAKESHIHLLFIMKGINQAHQKGDLVALEDLIKYELKDNLTQWKIDLIPQAKRYLTA